MRHKLFLLYLMVLISSCSGLSTIGERADSNLSVQRTSSITDAVTDSSDDLEESYEEEEPISLPPGMGPEGKKNLKYTHLTPGSLKVFDWPVDEARLSRGYFLKDPKGRRRRPHLGIDLANRRGTPIYASHDGKVIYVGSSFRGYGRMIMIEGRQGDYATLYAHLAKAIVRQGMWVKQGDLIGHMGSTGRSTGTHLHFEIRTLQGAVDPIAYLPPVHGERPSNIFGKSFNKESSENKGSTAEAL